MEGAGAREAVRAAAFICAQDGVCGGAHQRGVSRFGCLSLALALGGALFVLPSRAGAQAPAAAAAIEVRVTVVDSVTQRPIPRVHVQLLSDPRRYEGFTDARGVVRFVAVVAGPYGIRAEADGYRFAPGGDVTAAGGALQTFTVTGERTKLTRIGSVGTRAPAAPNGAQRAVDTDPSAVLAGGAGPAIPSITGIAAAPDGSLLIHGHDGGTTASLVNGAPVIPSTTKNQLGLLGSDIFSSASLGAGAIPGAPNGTLDARTYDPTIDWTGIVQERAASFGATASTVQQRGTAGRVGVSITHADAELVKPLDGRFFADTSGLAYTHRENAVSGGDAFTARYGFDANHVALVDLVDQRLTTPAECDVLSGPLPCGYGPGNVTRLRTTYAMLRDTLNLDRVTADVRLFASRSENAQLFGDERSAGMPIGYTNDAVTSRRGYVANIGVLYGRARVANVRVSSYRDVTQAGGSFVTSAFPPPVAANVSSVSVDLPLVSSRAFTLSAAAGHDNSAGIGHGTFDVRSSYQVTKRDVATASFGSGHLGVTLPSFAILGDPVNLTVDCADGTALGDGPLFAGRPAATTQAKAGVRHTGARVSLAIDAYRDETRNDSVDAIVPGTALPASLFSPSYLVAASQTAAARCGAATALTPANTFYRVAAPVERTVHDGVDASADFAIGSALKLSLRYSLSRARAFGSGFPFSAASGLEPGSQIPMIPLHQSGAQAAYALSRSLSLLGTVNAFGAGNTYRTRAFADVDAGARFATFAGDLTVAVQNVTNADGGPFARFEPFPYLATPFAPRTYSVRYRFAVGRQGIDRAVALSQPFSMQGAFAFEEHDFEAKPPHGDWLAPDTESPLCGPEQLPEARRYEDAIRAYDAGVRAALQADPNVHTLPPSTFGAVELSFVRSARGYAIRLHLLAGQGRRINPFTRCTRIHDGSYDDALRLLLYVPSWQEREAAGFSLYYAPQAGVYAAPQGVDETSAGEHEFRTGLPARAPADPFAVNPASCPATFRPAVEDALRSLKWYVTAVYAGQRATAPDGMRIVQHAGKAEPWLEIRAEDATFGNALATCLDMPWITPKDLATRGVGGANYPSFSYAPSIGFYRASIAMTK